MIRKLVLPALAAALLAGCVTDYGYLGGGSGGYYYGHPSIEFRYDYGMYPYGYGGYGTYGYPYRYYGAPYGYGGYYNYPYHRPYYPYYRPYLHHPRHHGPPQHRRDDDRRPPWRNYDELRRRPGSDGGGGGAVQSRPPLLTAPAPEPRARGSRMEQVIRRANQNAEIRDNEHEP